MKKKIVLLTCVAMTLTACEHINEVRTIPVAKNVKPAKSVFIDAKQRAITYVPTPTTTVITATNADGTRTTTTTSTTFMRVCSEPSPDALTAIATSAQGNLSVKDKLALGAALSRSESAASIGLRTQSIQLMRDALHRICEGYQSGSLTPAGVETLMRRFQSSMVGILAIEQLTGVVRAPAVILGGSASTGGAEAVAKIFEALVKAQADADAKATAAATAKTAHDDAVAARKALVDAGEADAGKLKAAQDKIDTAKKNLDEAKKASEAAAAALKTANAAMAAVAPGDGSTTSTGELQKTEPLGTSQTETVADAVVDIVRDTLQLGFLRETCATLMVASIEGRSNINPSQAEGGLNFADSCKAYFDETVVELANANEAVLADVALTQALVATVAETPRDPKSLEALALVIAAYRGGSRKVAPPAAPAALPAEVLKVKPARKQNRRRASAAPR